MFIYFTKVTKDFKNKYKSLKGKEIHNVFESLILRKLCSLNIESRLNSSLLPIYQVTNKQNLSVNLRKVFSIHLEELAVFF